MPRSLSYILTALVLALLIGVPCGYARYQQRQFRNFHEVKKGVLYRSGQLPLSGLKRILHDYGIKTVVTLRDADVPGNPSPDAAEEEYCRKEELNHVRITPRNWSAADGSVPAAAGVKRFLEVMRDPANHPVLIHCFAGIHRTGAHVAVYRMESDGWSNAQAISELQAHGYYNIDEERDLLDFLEHYCPKSKH
jgi:protein tyrosine/serine phosphatase